MCFSRDSRNPRRPPAPPALHFHPLPARSLSPCTGPRVYGDSMRTMELDGVIRRWKKTTRALKIHEKEYGKYLTDILEKRTDAELALFSDPVEAAAFFCLLDIARRTFGTGSRPACRDLSSGCVSGPVTQERDAPALDMCRPGQR